MLDIGRRAFGRQLRDALIGWSKDIKPVPKSGRTRFNDIGNLSVVEHTGAKNVDLSSIKFQQMLGRLEAEKPIDPIEWRGAVYAMGKPTKLNRGDGQPPPDPDAWMVGYINAFEGSRSNVTIDADKDAIYIQTDTPGYYMDPTNTAFVYYVGKLPVGTKLKVQCELRAQNEYRYGFPMVCSFRGWPAGWFGSETGQGEGVDYVDYVQFRRRTSEGYGVWKSYEAEIEIADGFQDMWIACEARSNESGRYEGRLNIGWARGIKVELA